MIRFLSCDVESYKILSFLVTSNLKIQFDELTCQDFLLTAKTNFKNDKTSEFIKSSPESGLQEFSTPTSDNVTIWEPPDGNLDG